MALRIDWLWLVIGIVLGMFVVPTVIKHSWCLTSSKPSAAHGTWHTHKYPGIRSDSDLYCQGKDSEEVLKCWRLPQ